MGRSGGSNGQMKPENNCKFIHSAESKQPAGKTSDKQLNLTPYRVRFCVCKFVCLWHVGFSTGPDLVFFRSFLGVKQKAEEKAMLIYFLRQLLQGETLEDVHQAMFFSVVCLPQNFCHNRLVWSLLNWRMSEKRYLHLHPTFMSSPQNSTGL